MPPNKPTPSKIGTELRKRLRGVFSFLGVHSQAEQHWIELTVTLVAGVATVLLLTRLALEQWG